MENQLDPTDALALAKGARERVAMRASASPVWYAPLYGLLCGALVMGGGLERPVGIAIVLVSIVGLGLLYRIWTNISGLSVNGYRSGRTRTIAILLGAALVLLMLAGLIARTRLGLGWAPVAAGAVAAVVAAFASHAWDRAWLAELRGDPA